MPPIWETEMALPSSCALWLRMNKCPFFSSWATTYSVFAFKVMSDYFSNTMLAAESLCLSVKSWYNWLGAPRKLQTSGSGHAHGSCWRVSFWSFILLKWGRFFAGIPSVLAYNFGELQCFLNEAAAELPIDKLQEGHLFLATILQQLAQATCAFLHLISVHANM